MSKKILVVDDSKIERKLISSFLEKKGFSVISLESGVNCEAVIEKENPHIVLLDIVMPKRSGNEVLLGIREKYSAVQLPVIMITARSNALDVMESLYQGANDYITKPIQFEIAIMRIYTQLKIAELSIEMAKYKEMEALHAMVATYNHEINNPLTVATTSVTCLSDEGVASEHLTRLKKALSRITDIVKKIGDITDRNSIEYDQYAKVSKMIKVK